MKFSRRKLVLGSVALLPLAYLSSTILKTSYEDIVVSGLRLGLPDLDFSDDVARLFAKDFAARNSKGTLRILLTAGALKARRIPLLTGIVDSRFSEFRDFVCHLFLQSTDIFVPGRDSKQPLNYVQFYDPYQRPCTNFLARLT